MSILPPTSLFEFSALSLGELIKLRTAATQAFKRARAMCFVSFIAIASLIAVYLAIESISTRELIAGLVFFVIFVVFSVIQCVSGYNATRVRLQLSDAHPGDVSLFLRSVTDSSIKDMVTLREHLDHVKGRGRFITLFELMLLEDEFKNLKMLDRKATLSRQQWLQVN